MVTFHALGGMSVTQDGEEVVIGGPRQRRLLAVLLIHRNHVVSIDRLADAVFAGEPTEAASTTLRSYIARLRRMLDDAARAADHQVDAAASPEVLTRAPGYLLHVDEATFDVACFERLVADARARSERHDAVGAERAATEALTWWRGDAYAEFADEEWAQPEAQRLGELRLVAHELRAGAQLAAGRASDAIPQLEALVAGHPLRESFRSLLVVALYRSGRNAEALRVLHDHRRTLADELGLDPSPALGELERRVLDHDPSLMGEEPPGLSVRGYRLGERLGAGRDGIVHAVRLPGVDHDFVVRILRSPLADDAEFIRSFDASMHQVASLRHPAIVPIHDHWREPGAAYVVMRRLHGGALSDRLERGSIDGEDLARIVSRIGGALAEASARGIVHGGVDPSNVLFDADGGAVLGGFEEGIARTGRSLADDVHDLATLVRTCRTSSQVDDAVAGVVATGLATTGRPSMREFVDALIAAMTGEGPSTDEPPINPYKGLRAFDESDAADFFGRAELVETLLARLARDDVTGHLVLVVGGSGSGKSSVVRAGLLPLVRGGALPWSRKWLTATMVPGAEPFKELAASLRGVATAETAHLADELGADPDSVDRVVRQLVPEGSELLLVIDQLEELFTLAEPADQRAFAQGLAAAVTANRSRLRVVATLRADFYDRPLDVQDFGALVNDSTVTVTPMSAAELESAIVEPVDRVGGRVERSLVAELVSAVVDEPAALPALQYTLYELAARRTDRVLTLAAYRELGGVAGAIASRAERIYRSLDDDGRRGVRRMFEQLVIVHPDSEPTRRRVARAELALLEGDDANDAIERWASARLLTHDRDPHTRVPTVEVAHEALLRSWPRLRAWVDESRGDLVGLAHLRDAASVWDELGRDPAALYRGAQLELALDVTGRRNERLGPREAAFLDASQAASEAVERAEADRIERQARTNRRLRVQLAAVVAALVLALAGGLVALDQRRSAERERSTATARELAAASAANVDVDPDLAILLARAAVDETRSRDGSVLPEVEESLHRAVSSSRLVLTVAGIGGAVDWSPSGSVFVTEGPEESGVIDIRDATTGASVLVFDGHDPDVNDVAFSADGSMLATTGDDGAVRIWDPATGEELMSYVDRDAGPLVWGPSFSPNDTLVATSWLGADIVRVIDVSTGAVVTEFEATAFGTAFSPDGTRLVMGDLSRGLAVVVDVASGDEVMRLGAGGDDDYQDIRSAAWSPDGRWIATTADDGAARIWDGRTGELAMSAPGHSGFFEGLAWSPDSNLLATGGRDGVVVWEIGDDVPRRLMSLASSGMSSGAYRLSFSPDGAQLLVGDVGVTTTTIWDVSDTGGGEWATAFGSPWTWQAAAFAPDDGIVLHAPDVDGGEGIGDVMVLDASTGSVRSMLRAPPGTPPIRLLALSPDGALLATSHADGPVRIVDMASGDEVAVVIDGEASDLSWSGNGERLAVAAVDGDDSRVLVVDRSGAELASRNAEPGRYFPSVSMDRDGVRVAFTHAVFERDDPTVQFVSMWDWVVDEVIQIVPADTPWRKVSFDVAGERLVTFARLENAIAVWDAESGRRIATFDGPVSASDAVFSPDGRRVATGHYDGTVRIWDASDGRRLLTLDGDQGYIETVAFDADGTKLVSVDWTGLVRVWALDLDDLLAIASDRLTRELTEAECRQYLQTDRCPTR